MQVTSIRDRSISVSFSSVCLFSGGHCLTDVVIDINEGIQQCVGHDNPDILRLLIDEKIEYLKLMDSESPKENTLFFLFACANLQ